MSRDMSMPSAQAEVFTVQRRRRFSAEEKQRLVQETLQPGMTISLVARQHKLSAKLLFRWRRLSSEGALSAIGADEEVVLASEVKAMYQQVRELQRLCANGERVRVAFSLDCCDRQAIALAATTAGSRGKLVRDVMVETMSKRFGQVAGLPSPAEWLSDDGSDHIARGTRGFAQDVGRTMCRSAIGGGRGTA